MKTKNFEAILNTGQDAANQIPIDENVKEIEVKIKEKLKTKKA